MATRNLQTTSASAWSARPLATPSTRTRSPATPTASPGGRVTRDEGPREHRGRQPADSGGNTRPDVQAVDILNLSPAGQTTFEDNVCVTSVGGPCPVTWTDRPTSDRGLVHFFRLLGLVTWAGFVAAFSDHFCSCRVLAVVLLTAVSACAPPEASPRADGVRRVPRTSAASPDPPARPPWTWRCDDAWTALPTSRSARDSRRRRWTSSRRHMLLGGGVPGGRGRGRGGGPAFEVDVCGVVALDGGRRWLTAGTDRFLLADGEWPLGRPVCVTGQLADGLRSLAVGDRDRPRHPVGVGTIGGPPVFTSA